VKDGTIRLDFAVITALFSHANYGIANPAIRTIKSLGFAEKRSRRLAKNEQSYLLSALLDTKCSDPKRANQYLPLVVIFATETACRLSEIVKDTKDHTTGVLWQNVKLNGDASTAQIFDTKNGKNRFVPLSPVAAEAIQAAGKLSNQEGAVFKTTASAIKQAWNRAKKRAVQQYQHDNKNGTIDPNFLINFRFHDLRHEAASRWKRHFNMAALQDLTGHSDIRSLARYLNSDEDDIADMATRMAEIQRKAGLLPPP
jgi:integrase